MRHSKNQNPFGIAGPMQVNNSFEVKRSSDTGGYTGGVFADRSMLREVTDEAYRKSLIELGWEKEPEPYVPTDDEIVMNQFIEKFGIDAMKAMLNGEQVPQNTQPKQELILPTQQEEVDIESIINQQTNSAIFVNNSNISTEDDLIDDILSELI